MASCWLSLGAAISLPSQLPPRERDITDPGLSLSFSIPRFQNTSADTILHSALLSTLLCRLILVCFWSKVCPYMGWKNFLTMKNWFVEQKTMSLTSLGIWLMTLQWSSVAKTYCDQTPCFVIFYISTVIIKYWSVMKNIQFHRETSNEIWESKSAGCWTTGHCLVSVNLC